MARWHLFEFEDLPGLPTVLRDGIREFLVASHRLMAFYKQWSPLIANVLRSTGQRRIIDLCSGGSGPVPLVQRELKEKHSLQVDVVMTDLFPNQVAIERIGRMNDPALQYRSDPVDATQIPADLQGVRTLFTAFHHLSPPLARRVLEDAFKQRQAICVFEYTERSGRAILSAMFYPLVVLLMTPWIRPLKLSQVLLTYVLPVFPALITWDGLVSNLRTYSPAELRELIAGLESAEYRWEMGVLRKPGYLPGLTYLVGHPVQNRET